MKNVKGRAMFQYSDPLTGLTTGNTTDVSKTLKINCNQEYKEK